MTPVRTPTDDPLARVRLEPPPRTDVAAIPGKYLSITSYRRDGSGVSTPVWFATEGDRLLVMTDSRSGKVKRIRRNPYVTIAPCSGRGKPKAKGKSRSHSPPRFCSGWEPLPIRSIVSVSAYVVSSATDARGRAGSATDR